MVFGFSALRAVGLGLVCALGVSAAAGAATMRGPMVMIEGSSMSFDIGDFHVTQTGGVTGRPMSNLQFNAMKSLTVEATVMLEVFEDQADEAPINMRYFTFSNYGRRGLSLGGEVDFADLEGRAVFSVIAGQVELQNVFATHRRDDGTALTADLVATPVPAAVLMMLTALCGLAGIRRKGWRRAQV